MVAGEDAVTGMYDLIHLSVIDVLGLGIQQVRGLNPVDREGPSVNLHCFEMIDPSKISVCWPVSKSSYRMMGYRLLWLQMKHGS